MLSGIIKLAEEIAALSRGAVKVAVGVNPMQPLDIWMWVKQFGQGKALLEDTRMDFSAPSILDGHSASPPSGDKRK